jgi:hypothetical protein
MPGGRLARLNLTFRFLARSCRPTVRDAESYGPSMDSAVTSTEYRTPGGRAKLTVHVRRATAGQRITFALFSPATSTGRVLLEFCRCTALFWGWLLGRLTAVGKSETELAIDIQLASRAAPRRFERADE